jgi:hypothetical protein
MTHAVTVHCQNEHKGFMVPLLSRYFEDAATKGQFVSHSMRNGPTPLHLKAYQKAIVLQNQFLSNICTLPVIGISPKALQQPITLGASDPERLIDVLNRYKLFTSIEPTVQSDKLGKHLFITASEQFDAAKQWIHTDLPLIWAELDHNFLDELLASIQCPRLATSNLTDDTTSRTVAMLNASRVPDDATVTIKWSKPPQIGQYRQPRTANTVNYTTDNFPAPAVRKRPNTNTTSTNNTTTEK